MKWNATEYPLRDYQQEFCRDVYGAWDTGPEGQPLTRLLGVAGTGAGKTIMASAVMFKAVKQRQEKCLFLADRDELVSQACAKIWSTTEIVPDREKGSERASVDSEIVVASIQTLQKTERLHRFDPAQYGRVIADEAHLSLAASWQKVFAHFAGAKLLGITATPARADKKALMDFYEHKAAEIGLFDLINRGALVPIDVITADIAPAVSTEAVESTSEDNDEIAEAVEPYWERIIDAWEEHARHRKTLVFHPSRKASKAFAERLRARGISAAHVDGSSKDREELLEAFALGRIQVLNNVQLLTTGYDEPTIQCIICLKPTKSKTLYQQMVGRGTRLWCPFKCNLFCQHEEAKRNLLLLDLMWQYEDLGVMTPADLIAEAPEQREALRQRLRAGDQQMNLQAIDEAVMGEREQAMIQQLRRNAGRQGRKFDARSVGALLHKPALTDYEPMAGWERKQPTQGQLAFLDRQGVDVNAIKSRGEASAVIATLTSRFDTDSASLKQVAWLHELGIAQAATFTFSEASAAIEARIIR